MNNTKIEWCDSTWNPVTGCLHGCEYCYARKLARRFGGYGKGNGSLAAQSLFRVAEISKPLTTTRNNGKTVKAPYPFGFKPTFHKYKLGEPQKMKKPRTIFVCSMADLFGEWVPDEWIEEVFAACTKAPQHTYLFLTKNPKRYVKLYEADKLPLEINMWYGASVTTSEQAEETAKHFGKLPASPNQANTFLSVEPMLFDITKHNAWQLLRCGWYTNWIIVGAETGNRKSKVIPQEEWIDSIATDCADYGIPVFMKDSLIPIVGEENMRREFPWKTK